MINCPKCDLELEVQEADPDTGVFSAGAYCDACDLSVDAEYEYQEGDVIISGTTLPRTEPLGTPLSELRGQPGPPNDLGHPDHVKGHITAVGNFNANLAEM